MPINPGYYLFRGGVTEDGGSGGGTGGGGIPAAILFQAGLSEPDRTNNRKWRGLLLGLERAQAGPEFVLATQARNPVDDTQAKYTLASGANSITITLPASLAVGADGNDWDFVTEASSDNVARVDVANRRIVVRTVGFGLAQLAGWINAVAALSGAAVVTGDGNTNFVGNAVPRQADFSGGVTAQAIGATIDAEATPPVVTLIYDNADTQMECRDAWEGFEIDADTTLRCSEVGNWDAAVAVEARASAAGRAFDLIYSEGALPAPVDLSGDWDAQRLQLQLGDEDPIELPTPDDLAQDQIQMVVSMSPGSLNKSNPPRNMHLTVTTPPGAFPTATTMTFRLDTARSGSVNYDPDVSVHNVESHFSEDNRNDIASHLVGQFVTLRVRLEDARSNVVHEVNRRIEVVEEAPLDPKILVGTLQWDVTPASIAGLTADDLEGTYRAQFDTPYFPLTDYYFSAFLRAASGTAQIIRDRAQWVQVTHLDLAIDATEAGSIANDLFAAGDDHFDIELHFFTDAVTIGAVAVTSRRIRIGQPSAGGGPEGIPDAPAHADVAKRYELYLPATIGDPEWRDATVGGAEDEQARQDAGRALTIANQNDRAITMLMGEVAAIPKYAATMAVWPPNVAKHSGFQRKFQSTLSGLDADLATDAGATGTYFTNVFRIFTRLADGTVVQLHTEGWAFTEDDRQTVEWEVSAAEFNAVGATAATNGVEVWGEFRAVYGGGVNELRGRTNPVFIDFGEQDEWPISRGAAAQAVANASDLGFVSIGTTAAFDAFLAKQADSVKPTLALFTAAISNHRYQGGPAFNIVENQLRYFKPQNVIGVNFFVLPGGANSGQSAAQVMAAIMAALPPFADIRLLPEAVPGSQVPDDIYVELAGKLTNREIDGLTLTIQGQTIQPHASTPVAGFDTETQALVRFDVSAVADAIANSIEAVDRTLTVDLTFSFTEGDNFIRRIFLPVNSPNAPRLVQGELDSIVFNAATTLDWLAPDMRTITLTADITFAFSNIQVGRPLVVEVVQNATGGNGITWPASVEWAGKVAQGPTAAGNARDIYTLLPLAANRVLVSAALDVGSP